MNTRLLLSRTEQWISVALPAGHDPKWSSADTWIFANKWLAARESGFSEVRATQIAEAFVARYLYPGLSFDTVLEKDIQKTGIYEDEQRNGSVAPNNSGPL